MPETGVGCTSCKELPWPSALASKVALVDCLDAAVTFRPLPSNDGGGPMELAATWSLELRPISD